MRKLLFVLFFTGMTIFSIAQESFEIKGIIFRNDNKQRIENVTVQGTKNNNVATSDSWGTFSINTFIGDTLLFKKSGFQDLVKTISGKQNLVIYLYPAILLDEITIREKPKTSEQKEILDAFRSKGVFFNGSPPFLFSLFHPLTAMHELLSKDAGNAKRFSNYIARENAQSAVDFRFNKALIMKHTDIKEEDIAEFMFYYRPLPSQITKWNEYDSIKYIRDSYQKYLRKEYLKSD